jgi:hypothetical protein
MACWRCLWDWQETGVWNGIHRVLLSGLRGADRIDSSHTLVDSHFVRAAFLGVRTGPNPTDRAKRGTKHHLIADARGISLAVKTRMQATSSV